MSSQVRMTVYAALATMATATTLTAVFSGPGWIVPVFTGIALVALSCGLVRASPLPSAFEPITAAVAVLLWVTALDARNEAHLGFIPGRTAFRHLSRVAQHGFDEIHRQPAPAPAHHGLVMLTVVGVAAIALVVDLMVVTLRRAALAGLPLLALFTICAATGKHGVSVIWFVVAAIGYLALLYADNRERVSRWGAAVGTGNRARPASAWSTDPSVGPAPASLGRRVGAMAISLGVLVPFLIPGLHTGIDKNVSGSGAGSGSGTITTMNPLVSVADDLQSSTVHDLFSYTTSAPLQGYLRVTTLNVFDGTQFSSASLRAQGSPTASAALPLESGSPSGAITRFQMEASYQSHLLPLPVTTLGVSVGDPWYYDSATSTVFSASRTTTTGGRQYTSVSIPDEPLKSELKLVPPATLTPALSNDLNSSPAPPISRWVRARALQVTAHAGDSPFGKAMAIENYFSPENGFSYDLHIKAYAGADPLRQFLTKKRGFCQQYAVAMAVMARVNGIPSRVAVGFTLGTKQKDGSYLVTNRDAHAWPELYFQGYGWLRFEPTPRGDGQAVPPSYATAGGGKQKPGNRPQTTPTTPPPTPPNQLTRHGSGSVTSTGGSSGHGPAGPAGIGGVILALIVLLGLAAPGMSRALTRRHRNRLMASDATRGTAAAWAELRDTAIDVRAPWDDGHTPRQLAATLGASLSRDDAGPNDNAADSEARDALNRLASEEERSRYARTVSPDGSDPSRDVAVVRAALRANRSRRQRLTATILPRSTTAIGRSYLTRVGTAKDRMARSVSQLLGRVRVRHS